MKRAFVTAVLLLLMGWTVEGATYYVRPDGDDARNGLTETGAWRSIDRGQPTVLLQPTKQNDQTVRVVKADQFPPRGRATLGKTTFTYTGRTLQTLTGCRGVPAARAGAVVRSPDYAPPQPGDTVIVSEGVYYLELKDEPISGHNIPLGVVLVRRGGTAEAPITFKARGKVIIDGRDEVISWVISGSPHVRVDGFDIRRGGLWVGWSDDVKLLNNLVHEGNRAVSVIYSSGCEVAYNRIYDFQGAWTGHGITLGPGEKHNIHHNTIVSNAYGIRAYSGGEHEIHHNLIAWCRLGIRFDEKRPPTDTRVYENNIWAAKSGIWLQRDDNIGTNHYDNVDPKPETDIHAEPMIVQWNPAKPNFLSPHPDSPCVKDGQAIIGAMGPAPYPESGNAPGENLVFNPSFEAGLLGWWITPWVGFDPGQAGYAIVEEDGAEMGRCLNVWDNPSPGTRINMRIQSLGFRYTRDRPVTISFRAKAAEPGTQLAAGMTFPSWQNKSGIGEKVKLDTQWKRYSVTLDPKPRFPDIATATFTTVKGRYWIDAVKVEEGATGSVFSPDLEFVPDEYIGMLVAPGQPLVGKVINRTDAALRGKLRWTLIAPFAGEVAQGHQVFEAPPDTAASFAIDLPKTLAGIFVLRYTFQDTKEQPLAAGKLRFSIGAPAPRDGRNHDFFAATPGYTDVNPGPTWRRQCQAMAALGLGTLHLYAGYARMADMLNNDRFIRMIDDADRFNLRWLLTPSDAAALTGGRTWAPAPGEVDGNAIEVKTDPDAKDRCTPRQLQQWAEIIRRMAKRYRGRIRYWEVLNEPNCFLDGEEYAKVLKVTSKALRDTDPGAHIIGGSVVNAHRKDLYNATMAMPPGTFDSFAFHPYRFGLPNPESEKQSYRKLIHETKQDLVANGHKPRLFLTEEGMSSGLNETRCIGYRLSLHGLVRQVEFGEGEILQAQYAARMYAALLGEGGIGYNYHTLQGLVHDSLMNPLLTLKSLHTMDSLLYDATPVGQLNLGRDYIGYLFTAPSRRVIAAIWPKDAEYAKPRRLSLRSPRALEAIDLLGMPLAVEAKKAGQYTVTFGRELIYLTFEPATSQTAKKTLEQAFADVHSIPDMSASSFDTAASSSIAQKR